MVILDVGAKFCFDSSIFSSTFPSCCKPGCCNSSCCEAGAIIDLQERDRILSLKDDLQKLLLEENRNPKDWFVEATDEEFARADGATVSQEEKALYPSTNAKGGHCVLYNPASGCALQTLALKKGAHKWAYKPSACILYPLFEDYAGVIRPDLDVEMNMWCTDSKNHSTSVFRACLEEIEFVAGKAAVEKLKQIEKDYASPLPQASGI